MAKYNLKIKTDLQATYQSGFLPQRNSKQLFYKDSSCRSNLTDFSLNSENRRILRKTDQFSYQTQSLNQFNFNPSVQKQIKTWIKKLGWDFPISSVKKIFTDHMFNTIYIWKNQTNQLVAYSVCYFGSDFSHIAYVFYDPKYANQNLPIRLSLQVSIDSHNQGLKYCYLGRFNSSTGFYKRNLPGFEFYNFDTQKWQKFTS